MKNRVIKFMILIGTGVMLLPLSSLALNSPRAAGMGNTFLAIADDHYTVFYNPAGVFQLTEGRIFLQYNFPLQISAYGISYVFSPAEKIRFATSFFREMEEQEVVLTYAGLISRLNWGVNVRFSSLGLQYKWAWDLGFLYQWGPQRRLGITISDLSNTLIYDSLQVIPQQWKMGISFPVMESLIISLDWEEAEGAISYGMEQYLSNYIFRIGSHYGHLTLGLGFKLGPLVTDYAYLTRQIERGIVKENVHLLGFALHF